MMIAALTGLLFCQLLGEVLVRALRLPLPGPVAGLGFLFLFLIVRGRWMRTKAEDAAVPVELGRVCDALLRNLSLLFIPAAVGVIQYLDLIRTYAVAIAIAVVVSTTSALVVTATTFRAMSRHQAAGHPPPADDDAPQP